ncbi:hypothetical protein D3C75_1336810 [compost metagenome]
MTHWSWTKSAPSVRSSVGRMTGTLEISRPNIRDDRVTAASAKVLWDGRGGIEGHL